MKLLLALAPVLLAAQTLPYHAVENWAKLPAGWNFGECSGVALDRDDNVWVFNRGPHPVIQFDPSGKMLRAWNEVPVKSAHGIRIDPQGNIWLIDVAGHKVLKMSPEGRVLMILGANGDAAGNQNSKDAFNRPTNIAFAPNGNLFITDGYGNSRVVEFTSGGDYVKHWGAKGTGDSEFNIVHDAVFDAMGRLYVADRENMRIQIFDREGKFLGKWTAFGAAWGLAYVPAENSIYVADGRNDRIVKLSMEGKVLGTLSEHGKTPGKLDYPHSIAVDRTGAIYVAEIRNWRVQKFIK